MELKRLKQKIENRLCKKGEKLVCKPEAKIGERNFIPYHEISEKCGCSKD